MAEEEVVRGEEGAVGGGCVCVRDLDGRCDLRQGKTEFLESGGW